MGKHRRRQFFIDKEFQGRYIFSAFISIIVGSVVFTLLIGFFSSNTLSIVYENYQLRLGATPSMLMNRVFSAQWLFILLGGVFVGVIVLFMSHRIAGPFYRIEKTLEKMKAGDLSVVIRLRKRDEGKMVGEKINEFNDMLSNRLGYLQQISENIQERCDSLAAEDNGKGLNELQAEGLKEISQLNRSCLDRIGEFKLK
jgi:methyl-accepting chemotaxis protein